MPNLSELCRACLTTKKSFAYTLFENVSPDIYAFCTSVEVYQDELPKSLCNPCYDLVTKYSEFKQTCIQSQHTLLGYKGNIKSEKVYANPLDGNRSFDDAEEKIKIEVEVEGSVKVENASEQFHDPLDVDGLSDEPLVNNSVKICKRKVKKIGKIKCCIRKVGQPKVQRKKFIYRCDLCQKKFNYLERFEAHKLEHEGKIVSINCLPCNKTFMTWSGLQRHNESEHTLVSLESLKCKTCGKILKNRQTLKMHSKTHGERRPSFCDVCGKGFTSAVVMRAHLETHKENRERRFTCEYCGKKFYTNKILMSHVSRRHTGRLYICQICSRPFTDKYNLSKHLLIHEGKKLHKCEICEKSFTAPSTLLEHKRIHSGERPYVCNYCPKAFVSKKRLTDHIRVHTGDRPYECSACCQRFTQRGTLKRHMKIHDRTVPSIN